MENNGKTIAYGDETYTCPLIEELIPGVYNTGLNPDLPHAEYENYPTLGEIETMKFSDGRTHEYGSFNAYGVCDNYQQILDQCPEIVTGERRFVITLAEMRKDGQPDQGGWRWHKWGPYIGTHEPQCEYLHDEPVVENVFCFHIYEKKEKA